MKRKYINFNDYFFLVSINISYDKKLKYSVEKRNKHFIGILEICKENKQQYSRKAWTEIKVKTKYLNISKNN